MAFHRYVALGDSFTEGVGDPDPTRPNGLRGWADRVAGVLASEAAREAARESGAAGEAGAAGSFGYANLAIRGRKLDGVLAEQLEPALALAPDLVTVYAGGNDILRPRVDLDGLVDRYDEALGRLAATGARLLVFTAFDPGGSAIYAAVRGRFALYNELVRAAADRHGADIVDFWRLRELRDWGYWDADRMHLGPAGHRLVAAEVLAVLGVARDLAPEPLRVVPTPTRLGQARADLEWARTSAVPWVQRRLTGRSSGDTVSPRYPDLSPIE